MDHDRLFKELLTTFFAEFVQLFLPDMAAYLDPDSLEFLDKEVFTDVTAGEKHEADLVVRAKFRGQDAFFLVHVENQSTARAGFPKRMFVYFARLHEKYDLPVYPVVIFSHDAPRAPQPGRYRVAFPGRDVLDFRYTVIQLNRLPWRRFVRQHNPVAAALMAKMRMAERDRPRVKLECLRLLATLKLDPARARLIAGFVESYLRLTAPEQHRYEQQLGGLGSEERKGTMEFVLSWELDGMFKGKREMLRRQMARRVGAPDKKTEGRVEKLSLEQLDSLAEDLLDMNAPEQLEAWLNARGV